MKINWTLRLKNKVTLITLVTSVIAFIYQMLAIFGFAPKISEDTITELVMMIINMLVTLGIIVDPTTAGINDSERAMSYSEPK